MTFIFLFTYSLIWCITHPTTRCLHIVQPVLFAALFYKSTVFREFRIQVNNTKQHMRICKWTRRCDEYILLQKNLQNFAKISWPQILWVLQCTRTEFIVLNSYASVDTITNMQIDIDNSVFLSFSFFFFRKKDIW